MFKNSIYIIISILILFPYPLNNFNVKGYPLSASYILMLLVFIFLPVALMKKSYWRLPLSKLMWAMRLVFIFIFLTASFTFGLNLERVISFIGYLMISFLYEIPFIFDIEIKGFFKIFNVVFLLVLIYATCVIGYFNIINERPLIYNTYIIRDYLFLYPNHFSILLILIFWIRQYFVEKHSRIVDVWIVGLIFISLSRVAIASFVVTFIVNILMNKDINKWKKPLVFVVVLSLLLQVSIYLIELKEQSPGSTLERTYYSRVARWVSALEHIKRSPILGTGFDRTTSVISSYRSLSGQQEELGSMHNDYLDLLLKGGILGLISFLTVLVSIFITGFKYNKSLVVLALTIMLTAFFQNPIKNIPIMFCLYFTTGVVLHGVSQNSYIERSRKKAVLRC